MKHGGVLCRRWLFLGHGIVCYSQISCLQGGVEPQDVESGSLGKFLFVNVEFAIGLDAGR